MRKVCLQTDPTTQAEATLYRDKKQVKSRLRLECNSDLAPAPMIGDTLTRRLKHTTRAYDTTRARWSWFAIRKQEKKDHEMD